MPDETSQTQSGTPDGQAQANTSPEPNQLAGNDPNNKAVDRPPETPPTTTPPPKADEKAANGASALDVKALKAPEGIEIDPKSLEAFAPIAQELGLTQEGAQRLLDFHVGVLKEAAGKPYQLFEQQQNAWVDEVKADPEIGGDKLPQVQQTISKALDVYGDPKFKEAMAMTGAGNNPAVVRTIYKMAQALTEGQHIQGKPTGDTKPPLGATALYPTLPPG